MPALKDFYGKDEGPHSFATVEGAKIWAGWVITERHLFLLWDIMKGARNELVKLSENDGLSSMLLSGEVSSFDKRQRTFERHEVRAVLVMRDSNITVYTETDAQELRLGSSSEEAGRRIAAATMPNHEVVEAPDEVTSSFLSRKPKISPGKWQLFRLPGWTSERLPDPLWD